MLQYYGLCSDVNHAGSNAEKQQHHVQRLRPEKMENYSRSESALRNSYPEHWSTGKRGYLENFGSLTDRSHR